MNVIEALAESGWPLWGAGAYRGGDTACSNLPDLDARYQNTLKWLELNSRFHLKGIVITGWSRYSTYCPQIEPIESALDCIVGVGEVLETGEIPDKGLCDAILLSAGELENFQICHEAMREYDKAQKEAWLHIRVMAEQMAIQMIRKGMPRRESLQVGFTSPEWTVP